mgnify:FL=1
MGQDHGGIEPRNQGSEGKESALHVGTDTVSKQRTVVREREGELCVDTDRQTNKRGEQLVLSR